MTVRVLVVDDEPLARQRLRRLLEAHARVLLVGECAGGEQAVQAIAELRPDLVFLDVQMPEVDGFAVLRRTLAEHLPVVIFTTAHDQHALRAFEVHALDYLVKPYKAERFHASLSRAIAQVSAQASARHLGQAARGVLALLGQAEMAPAMAVVALSSAAPAAPHAAMHSPDSATPALKRLTVKSDGRTLVIAVEDVDCIESAGNYVGLQVGDRTHILRETLNALELQLDPRQFARISRGAIVNMTRVSELLPTLHGGHVVVLRSGKKLPMTRALKDLEQLLRYR
jgi:two-component system, LytTR family, response regulator